LCTGSVYRLERPSLVKLNSPSHQKKNKKAKRKGKDTKADLLPEKPYDLVSTIDNASLKLTDRGKESEGKGGEEKVAAGMSAVSADAGAGSAGAVAVPGADARNAIATFSTGEEVYFKPRAVDAKHGPTATIHDGTVSEGNQIQVCLRDGTYMWVALSDIRKTATAGGEGEGNEVGGAKAIQKPQKPQSMVQATACVDISALLPGKQYSFRLACSVTVEQQKGPLTIDFVCCEDLILECPAARPNAPAAPTSSSTKSSLKIKWKQPEQLNGSNVLNYSLEVCQGDPNSGQEFSEIYMGEPFCSFLPCSFPS
jgi:hypothetical protein